MEGKWFGKNGTLDRECRESSRTGVRDKGGGVESAGGGGEREGGSGRA